MADVVWTKIGGVKNSDVYEAVLDATDSDTAVLELDSAKSVSVAIKTTGAATVALNTYFEDTSNSGLTSFVMESGVATAGGVDYVKSLLGGTSGLKLVGTIAGADTATVQVLATSRE